MTDNIAGIIAAATAVIGFVAVWIRVGNRLGKNESTLEALNERMGKAEKDIAGLKNDTHEIKIEIARFMGVIEGKFDYIKEIITDLKGQGGHRAAEK
jgi:uncharacterized protein YoxC